jgi:predicted RNase H-like HicB family nuclease
MLRHGVHRLGIIGDRFRPARSGAWERLDAVAVIRSAPVSQRAHGMILLSPDIWEDGFFMAEVPALRRWISQGDTREVALDSIREAIVLYLARLTEHQEPIAPSKTFRWRSCQGAPRALIRQAGLSVGFRRFAVRGLQPG